MGLEYKEARLYPLNILLSRTQRYNNIYIVNVINTIFLCFNMNFQRPTKNTILLILTVALATLIVSSSISIWLSKQTRLDVPSIGIIKTIGVEAYWNENLDNKTEAVNWDIIWLGSSKNVTMYLRSISNVETVFQLNGTNWNPTNISKCMNLYWNYSGTPVKPGEVIPVTITLSTTYSRYIIDYLTTSERKEFTFDIVITAIE